MIGKLPAPNFAHTNVNLPHLKDSKPSTPALIVEGWDISSGIAHSHDVFHTLNDKARFGQIERRNINAPIAVNPDISFDHANNPDVSI